jgi:hypothetical protein
MSYQLSFATLVQYDPGQPSITVAVTLLPKLLRECVRIRRVV